MHHLWVCLAVTGATFLAILCILSRHGYVVQLCTCVYVISLTLTQLLMAELSSRPFLYRYPAYVTVLHFLSCWIFSVAYWAAAGDLGKCHPRSLGGGGRRRFLVEVLPIAVTMPVAVACNNVALLYLAAGLNSVVGALTPAATALLSRLLGRAIPGPAWAGLLLALAGAVVVSLGEAGAAAAAAAAGGGGSLARGLALALAAVALRALKSVLQDRLLNAGRYRGGAGAGRAGAKEGGEGGAGGAEARKGEARGLLAAPAAPLSPMHLWALQAPPMVLVSLVYALCTESLPGALRHVSLHNVALILVTCASATVLNILGVMTIKALGASLMQAIGKLNVIVTMAFSVAFLGETLPLKVAIGAAIMLLGIVLFEHAEHRSAGEQRPPFPGAKV